MHHVQTFDQINQSACEKDVIESESNRSYIKQVNKMQILIGVIL